MRAASCSLIVLGLGSLACTIDNPGFFVTDGVDGSGGGATTGDASTTGRTTTDPTTDATTHGTTPTSTSTSTTDPSTTSTTVDPSTTGTATTDPLTSGSSGDTSGDGTSTGDMSSSSDGSTSSGDVCELPVAPEFDLGFASSKGFFCNPGAQYLFYAEPLEPSGPNAWKMRVCTNDINGCKSGDSCFSQETVTLHFDGPAEFVPKLDNATCHQVGVLARGLDQNDPEVCRLRLMRLAHTGFDTLVVDYVGAVGVPDSNALPAPWPSVIPLAVVPAQVAPCDGDPVCNALLPGAYELNMHWLSNMKQYGVPEGGSVGESISVKKNGVATDILGSFTNVSSHAHPDATCDDGLEFNWLWFADLVGP